MRVRSYVTNNRPGEPFDASKVHEDIKYTKEDDQAIDDWIAGECTFRIRVRISKILLPRPCRDHLAQLG